QLQKNEHAEDRKKELLQEMRMRGNLPWLIVQIKGQEYRHEIDNPLFTIGREESNSLCIPVSTISRRHALIKFNHGEYLIEDLQSSNGVVVNGEKYQEILLAHGDVVQLGDVYLTFMI
ncbi:MAG: FHA domain-containing protein, partial [Flavobacteriia bacterium]|nr:FHA domain-containing protein [Flavobacteriia bacterium]